jgi:hypothetical protein
MSELGPGCVKTRFWWEGLGRIDGAFIGYGDSALNRQSSCDATTARAGTQVDHPSIELKHNWLKSLKMIRELAR